MQKEVAPPPGPAPDEAGGGGGGGGGKGSFQGYPRPRPSVFSLRKKASLSQWEEGGWRVSVRERVK